MTTKHGVIRTIYLYLFALVGLALLVIGTSMIINVGLKAFVFPNADKEQTMLDKPYVALEGMADKEIVEKLNSCGEECGLDDNEQEIVARWLEDYEEWEARQEEIDPEFYTKRNRARQSSSAVSMILVGLPLWLAHWGMIKKDLKRKKEE